MKNIAYQPYSTYKESGLEWVGEVPAEWQVQPFFVYASQCKRSNQGMVNDNLLSLSYGRIIQKNIDTSEGLLPESFETYQIIEPDDIVFRLTDLQNDKRSLRSAICQERGIITSAYLAAKPTGIESKYLAYLMRSYDLTKVFYALGSGLRQSLKFSDMKRLPLLVPTPEEQTQIAKFLDYETAKIDALIDKQRQLIALLQEKRQAVISHAVTKGLNPAAPLRDSGVEWLGAVPAHWEEYPLKALFGLKHGYAFDSTAFSDSGEFILMTPGNFNERGGFRHKIPEKFYTGNDIPKDFILKHGQLLVAMTEQGPGLLGCALFVPEKGTYLHNQRLGLVHKIRRDKVSVQYLFHLFNSRRYRAEVSISSTGAKVQHTSPTKILSIKIWLPPLFEQEQIARFVDERIEKVDVLEVKAEQTIDLLQERRTALISAAVTGKIDVRGWQPPPAKAEGATP